MKSAPSISTTFHPNIFRCEFQLGTLEMLAEMRVDLHIVWVNPLNGELNPICHLLALLGPHHILHVSRIRVNTVGQYCTNAHFDKFQYALLHPNFINDRLAVVRLTLFNIQMEVLKNTKSYYHVFNYLYLNPRRRDLTEKLTVPWLVKMEPEVHYCTRCYHPEPHHRTPHSTHSDPF